MTFQRTFISLLMTLTLLTGCYNKFIHRPSFQLGKNIDLTQWSPGMSKNQVISTFGPLTVPCKNADNICYIRAEILELELEDSEFVEFVFDENQNLDHVLFSKYAQK